MNIVMIALTLWRIGGSRTRVAAFQASAVIARNRRSTLSQRYASTADENTKNNSFLAQDTPDFAALGIQSPILLNRLSNLGLKQPTLVQAATFDAMRGEDDVLVGAATGSGKTLAYLLPIMDEILCMKEKEHDYCRAIILVPNKELVQQVVRMAIGLAGGREALVYGKMEGLPEGDDEDAENMVRLAIMPGGLKEPLDFPPFRQSKRLGGDSEPVDIVVTTPASLGPLGLKPGNIELFADVATLVVDEADMLLDGGYIRQLEHALLGFKRADKLHPGLGVPKTRHVFVAATLPDYGTKSVDAYLAKRFPYANRIALAGMHQARHVGLVEPTLWRMIETKQDRLQELVKLVQTPVSDGGLLNQKIMVFVNSVENVEGACQALLRAGVEDARPYHAKLPLAERTVTLDLFRKYENGSGECSILVCSDLAARGMDIPGVDAVVQLQFAGNVVSHLHRMGRCGRAGASGRGIVFYGAEEEELVEVVQQAERAQEKMVLPGDVMELDEEEDGTVQQAFSRKRGFTKKRKKLRRE